MKQITLRRLVIKSIALSIPMFFILTHSASAQIATCEGPQCDVTYIYSTIDAIITFLMRLMVPLAAIGFAIGGFMILFSGGNEGRVSSGKQVMWGVLFGMLMMLFAYIIVKTLLQVLV